MKRIFVLLISFLVFVSPAFAADYTKSVTSLQDWTTLDDTGATPSYESTAVSVTDDIETIVHIIIAHQDANAAGDSAYVCVDISSNSSGDDDWHELTKLAVTGGTANAQVLAAASGSGQPNEDRIEVASTTNFENPGDWYFLKDVGTLADSCVVCNYDYVNDDYVQVVDNLANAYDSSDYLYDIVDMWSVTIPPSANRFRVRAHNEDADATYALYIRYTKVTDIE